MTPAPEPPLTPVERILFEILERGGGEADLHGACREHETLAGELRARYALLHEHGLLADGMTKDAAIPKRLGDFALLRVLGGGGMGVVYAARQESVGREVALKLIRPEHLWFPGRHERFRREAEALAKLSHPGIAQVHVVGEENGIPFLAQELVVGSTLAQCLHALRDHSVRELRGSDFGVPTFTGSWLDACIQITRAVAQALSHAHERGVLHRDVKPSNVMLSTEGRVVLIDFGLARAAESASLTQTGAAPGSLPYMAPETLAGERVGFEPRIDVYATGLLFYELMTKTPAFADANPERLRTRILAGDLEPPRKRNKAILRDAEIVCLRALDVDPRRRYATMAHFADDLAHLLALEPIDARPTSASTRAFRAMRKRPWTTAGTAIGTAAALAIAIPFWWIHDKADLLAAGHTAQVLERYEEALADAMRLWESGASEAGNQALQLAESLGVDEGEVRAYRIFSHLQKKAPEAALACIRSFAGEDRRVVARLEAWTLRELGEKGASAALEAGLPPPMTPAELFWDGVELFYRSSTASRAGTLDPADATRAHELVSRSVALAQRPRLQQICYRLATAMHIQDTRAMRECIEVLERYWPNSGTAWYWIGYARSRDDWQGAATAFERSLRLMPTRADAHHRLCDLWIRNGELATAEAAVARFTDAMPEVALAWLCRSHLESRKRDLGKALAAAQKAVELDPKNANAHSTLASHATTTKQYALAETHARMAIALEPGNPTAHVQLGDTLFFLHRSAEGVEHARRGVELIEKAFSFPKDLQTLSQLSLARLLIGRGEEGDRAEAKRILEAAVRLDPKNPTAHAFAVALWRGLRDRDGLAAEETRYVTATRPSPSRPSSR